MQQTPVIDLKDPRRNLRRRVIGGEAVRAVRAVFRFPSRLGETSGLVGQSGSGRTRRAGCALACCGALMGAVA